MVIAQTETSGVTVDAVEDGLETEELPVRPSDERKASIMINVLNGLLLAGHERGPDCKSSLADAID